MTEARSISNKRVLVIAYPELARAIYTALNIKPPRWTVETSREGWLDISQMCSIIFPPSDKPTASDWNLFQWGNYDIVIIQDLWLNSKLKSQSLEYAGYVFASLNHYYLGKFSTKVTILITDSDFGWWRSQSSVQIDCQKPSQWAEALQRAFDEKCAFQTINLVSPNGLLIKRLREALLHQPKPNKSQIKLNDIIELQEPVIQAMVEALRSYINSQAEIIMVEDEAVALREMFKIISDPNMRAWTTFKITDQALAGMKQHGVPVQISERLSTLKGRDFRQEKDFWEAVHEIIGDSKVDTHKEPILKYAHGIFEFEPGRVNIAVSSQGPSQRSIDEFGELASACEEEFYNAIKGGKRYVFFVTDILFDLPHWTKTGIDLIEAIRKSLGHRIGIVAFTGFASPFITMSAYQRGADFVVQKEGAIRGRRHDPIITSGTDRLLLSLAFLCFQKSFLRDRRSQCIKKLYASQVAPADNGLRKMAAEALHQMQAILPQHAVSPQIQQEWLDTYYFFEAILTYGPESERLKWAHKEVVKKYDK